MRENTAFPCVFSPLTIRGLTLKNRLQYAPTVVLKCSPEGDVVDEMIEYVKWQAATGAAYLTIGNTPIVHEDGSAWLCELDVTSDRCIHGVHRLATAARDGGAEISVELAHAGRGSHTSPGRPALAPSRRPLPGRSADDLKEMDRADMDFIRDQFCACALRCKQAGMRIVMIHAAHQNLLAQFLSPDSNARADEYGGSLANRMRYPLEVLQAVRRTVGDDVIVELRVSAQEDTPGGLELPESIEFIEAAEPCIDIVHVSRGNIHGPAGTFTIPTYFKARRLNVAFAAEIKRRVKIPVAVVGNITSLAEAERIIAEGKADIVAMAKAYMADQELIPKSLAGRAEDVRPCTRCDTCGNFNNFGRSMRCAVNPTLGLSIKTRGIAARRKRVMVIGGGPGGMTAAQTLAEMGHSVTLYEKSDSLGGLLKDATLAPFKEYLRLYLQWTVRQTLGSGAEIRLNAEATAGTVAEEDPDAVVVASGSRYIVPRIPGVGLPTVKTAADAERRPAEVGRSVVICGAGIVGLECALALAMEGKKVRVVDAIPRDRFAAGMPIFNRIDLFDLLERHGVELEGDRIISGFDGNLMTARDASGREHRYSADHFVLALGVRPDDRLAKELLARYPAEVHAVGDCGGPGRSLYEANQEAFHAALRIDGA